VSGIEQFQFGSESETGHLLWILRWYCSDCVGWRLNIVLDRLGQTITVEQGCIQVNYGLDRGRRCAWVIAVMAFIYARQTERINMNMNPTIVDSYMWSSG
jgi:hypothetical protein